MAGRTDDERGDSGEYGEKYPRESFISAIRKEDDWISTTDIADKVGCRQNTAWHRLEKLKENGMLETKKYGNTRVWRLSDEGKTTIRKEGILDYIESEKPTSTSEMSGELDIDREELESLLFELEDEDKIKSSTIGDETVWTT